jgi:hypothetical protein
MWPGVDAGMVHAALRAIDIGQTDQESLEWLSNHLCSLFSASLWNSDGRKVQLRILQCIGGNCDKIKTIVQNGWLTPNVIKLTRVIEQEENFDTLPILADALEEAGCTDAKMLDHCRLPGKHYYGCWVIEDILRKAVQNG